MFNLVDNLRSLSVELAKENFTVQDAKKGLEVSKAFKKRGVSTEKHTDLVRVCQKVDDPGFIHAAFKLAKLEAETGLPYEELLKRYENVMSELPRLEHEVQKAENRRKSVQADLHQTTQELAATESDLVHKRKEAKEEVSRLKHEFEEKQMEYKVKLDEVEVTYKIKAELAEKGLDIPTIMTVSKEFSQSHTKEGLGGLRQSISDYGALRKSVDALKVERNSLGSEITKLKQSNAKLSQDNDRLFLQKVDQHGLIQKQIRTVKELEQACDQQGRQYELFLALLSMATDSPSLTYSIEEIMASFQTLVWSGWCRPKEFEHPKDLFVKVVLGDLIKSYRCDHCGTGFIVDKEPQGLIHYTCPACPRSFGVRADDRFLRALVSEGQLDEVLTAEALKKENDALKPLEAFLKVPCRICNNPITEWSRGNVDTAVAGHGFAHDSCWNSTAGMLTLGAYYMPKIIDSIDRLGK